MASTGDKTRGPRKSRAAQVREQLREQNRAAYRDAILEAAERVFAERGFSGARMSDVAAEAGMATGTLYNYFENKDEIFRSLIHAHGEHLMRRMAALHEEETDPRARIEAMVRACFAYLEQHQAAYAVFVELGGVSESSLGRFCGSEITAHYGEYVSLFTRAIADAARAGCVRRDVPAHELSSFLTGAMNGVVRMWLILDIDSRLVDRADLVTELFFSGAGKTS